MRLDGPRRDPETTPDLVRGEALGEQPEDLALAGRDRRPASRTPPALAGRTCGVRPPRTARDRAEARAHRMPHERAPPTDRATRRVYGGTRTHQRRMASNTSGPSDRSDKHDDARILVEAKGTERRELGCSRFEVDDDDRRALPSGACRRDRRPARRRRGPPRRWRLRRAGRHPRSPAGSRRRRGRSGASRREASRGSVREPSGGRRHRQRAGAPREPDRLDLRVHAELRKHVLDVALHGHDADRQRVGDLLRRAPVGEECKHLTLAARERVDASSVVRIEAARRGRDRPRRRGGPPGRISSPAAARRSRSGTARSSVDRAMIPAAPAAITEAPTSGSSSSLTARIRTPPSASAASRRTGSRGPTARSRARRRAHREAATSASATSRTGPSTDTPVRRQAKREVMRQAEAPLHHQHSDVYVHPHTGASAGAHVFLKRETSEWWGPRTASPMPRARTCSSTPDNPVDWFPWGDEAFARARARDMPIFLSVGYAACHWCHVMERESFEDAETAALHQRPRSSRSRWTAKSGPTWTRSTWTRCRR